MSTRKTVQERQMVIVRAWGNEPVVLVAHGLQIDTNRVLVGKNAAKPPISLPMEDVFDYDEERFTQLSQAFSTHNDENYEVFTTK